MDVCKWVSVVHNRRYETYTQTNVQYICIIQRWLNVYINPKKTALDISMYSELSDNEAHVNLPHAQFLAE